MTRTQSTISSNQKSEAKVMFEPKNLIKKQGTSSWWGFLTFFKLCLEKEEQNEISSSKLAESALQVYEDCVDLCSNIINYMLERYYRKVMSKTNSSILLIVNRLLVSSQALRVLILKGYYYEASILARSYTEGVGLSIFLFENPKEAEKWQKGKKLDVAAIKLFELIPKSLGSEFSKETKAVYGSLCNYVHSNLPAVLDFLDLSNFERHLSEGKKVVTVEIRQTPFDFDKYIVDNLPVYVFLLGIILLQIFSNEIEENQNKVFMKQLLDLIRKWKEITNVKNQTH